MRFSRVLYLWFCVSTVVASLVWGSHGEDEVTQTVAPQVSLLSNASVITLTDKNFEHDTQVGTGMTTGDWLVLFYASWCPHCSFARKIWPNIVEELKGSVNVAWVDGPENYHVRKRLNIRFYPEIVLFHKSKMYFYKGRNSVQDIKAFALKTGNFLKTPGTYLFSMRAVYQYIISNCSFLYVLRS